jgi:hypothetical protein
MSCEVIVRSCERIRLYSVEEGPASRRGTYFQGTCAR